MDNTYCALLKYHEQRNCFGYIQQRYNHINQTANIQVAAISSSAYNVIQCKNSENCCLIQIFAPNGRCYEPQILFINKIFADLCGFHEDEEVIVQKMETATACSSFEVELISAEDWNIIQNSSQQIEELLLGQLQLITVGQTYPIWVAQNVYVHFTVVRIEALSCMMQNARICESTEVHVKPFRSMASNPEMKNDGENVLDALPTSFTCRIETLNCSDVRILPFIFRIQDYFGNANIRISARVLPEIICNDDFTEGLDILAVFRISYDQSSSEMITISSVSNCETGNTTYALYIELPMRCSHFAGLRDCLKQYDSRYCALSPALHHFMNGEYEWIKISPLSKSRITQLKILEILSEVDLPEDFDESLKDHLWKTYQHYPIIVPVDGLKLEIDLNNRTRIRCLIRPQQIESMEKDNGSSNCFLFTNDIFPKLVYINAESMKDNNEQFLVTKVNESSQQAAINFGGWKNEAIEFSFQTAFVEKCYEYIMYHLENSINSLSENLLITGEKSMGKTVILQIIAQKLLHSHLAVYSECLNCVNWNGKSTEKFEELIKAAAKRLGKRNPSVLFLDNLDFFPRSKDEDVRNVRLERCAELLKHLVDENDLLVVATACAKHEVIDLFSQNGGGRFFGHVESIQKLGLAEREECLRKFCNKEAELCNLRNAVEATEKYTVGDLERLARRIVLEAKASAHEKVEESDVQQALREFRPNVLPFEQQKSMNVANLKWNDIGGLKNVKQILTEVFIWPTKYPSLYRSSSIRLGRGVLLHGPSGCGKTHICKVLAAEWGFSVIFIKGPELLSKFVGESEENVRKIFERARATSPCLIFFDEFDSLGPKRGDGDTGVTDRVVNQLLTELDGVEGLEDVYVIATTNRIDLIDNALLRPGRFDFIIKCELPRKDDRISILDVLCRDVRLEKDVDLEVIAIETDGWTGADLKGLVTNAQLIAHKRKRGAFTEKGFDLEENAECTVCQADLLNALKESQPNRDRRSPRSDGKPLISPGILTTLA